MSVVRDYHVGFLIFLPIKQMNTRTLKLKLEVVTDTNLESEIKKAYNMPNPSKIVGGNTRAEIIGNLKQLNNIVYKIYNFVSGKYHSILSTTYPDETFKSKIPFKDIRDEVYQSTKQFALSKYDEIGGVNGSMCSLLYHSIFNDVSKYIKNNFRDLSNGNKMFPYYRRGCPIYVASGDAFTRFVCHNGIFYLYTWGFLWKIILGCDRCGYAVTLNNIVNDINNIQDKKQRNYVFNDSSIELGNKILFNMTITEPSTNVSLNPNIIVGVDLGLVKPIAMCAFNKSFKNKHGINGDIIRINGCEMIKTLDGNEINSNPYLSTKIRNRYSALNIITNKILKDRTLCRYEKAQRCHNDNYIGTCGKGYKRKMKTFISFGEKESRIAKNYAHTIAKNVVKFAIEHKASEIHLEHLSFNKNHKLENPLLFSIWGYFDIFNKIKEKASRYGIKVVEVNPKYTSKICSECEDINNVFIKGTNEYNRMENLTKDNDRRLSQSIFACPCGNEMNADYNASINIARCTNIIE